MDKTQNIFRSATVILFLLVGACATFAQPQLPFVAEKNNPILERGESGAWDEVNVYLPEVLFHDGLIYLFYSAAKSGAFFVGSIGFATSTDGFNFTKSDANPIFEPDGTGFDRLLTAGSIVLIEEDVWILYYGADATRTPGPPPFIGRATAPDPTGPWTRLDEPVLQVGSPGEWDGVAIVPHSIFRIATGHMMFYGGSQQFPFGPHYFGVATSTDGGFTWEKYDDPATTEAPFAESDPILKPGPPGSWDGVMASLGSVLKTENGWEMFYTGTPSLVTGPLDLGYATSPDGIIWTKDLVNNPILTSGIGPGADPYAQGFLASVSALIHNGTYFLYYHYGSGPPVTPLVGIGLATAPALTTSIDDIAQYPLNFSLFQNYPNPFNPSTTIAFSVQQAGEVTLDIYNLRGERVRTLVSGPVPAGRHQTVWDATDNFGVRVASGVYIYQLQTINFIESKKLILIK